MAIPIQHEDVEELKKWGLGLDRVMEHCFFCDQPTRYWHLRTNNPCCQACAKARKVIEFKSARATAQGAAGQGGKE